MRRYGNENEAGARVRNNKSTLHGLRLSSPVLYLYYFNIGLVRKTALGELKGWTKAKRSRQSSLDRIQCYRNGKVYASHVLFLPDECDHSVINKPLSSACPNIELVRLQTTASYHDPQSICMQDRIVSLEA